MARGESEANESNAGAVAIWAVFGVACLAVAWVVVRVSVDDDEPEDPFGTQEPHPGIEGPLRALGHRGCGLDGGPRVGPGTTVDLADVQAHLERRGYLLAREPSAAEPFPIRVVPTELEGACGVVASVTDTGWGEHAEVGRERYRPCTSSVVLAPVCDTAPVDIEGHGEGRVAVFEMPGLAPPEDGGAKAADVHLAHAEAAALLAASGWTPLPDGMEATLSGGTLDPLPEHPRGGCVPFVVAGSGAGHTSTSWLGRPVDSDPSPDGFLAGVVVCEGARQTALLGSVAPGATPLVVARPYRMSPGPSLARPSTHVPLQVLGTGEQLALPDPLTDRGAE